MDSPRSTHRQTWDGQEPADASEPRELSWGEGSASALESLRQREQRRDHSTPRQDEQPQHPQAEAGADQAAAG